MISCSWFSCVVGVLLLAAQIFAKTQDTCEVCVAVVKEVMAEMPAADVSNTDKINEKLREVCGSKKGKEQKFVSKPMSWQMPADKVCDKLRSKDSEICALKFDDKNPEYKAIDWKTVDLPKLRVKELKKILEEWGEVCKGCTEKTEFVKKIEELKSKYVKTEL